MRSPLLALPMLLLLGCFSPTFPPGLRCSPTAGCPPDQRCEVSSFTCQVPSFAGLGSGAERVSPSKLLHSHVAAGQSLQLTAGYTILADTGVYRVLWAGSGMFQGSLYVEPHTISRVVPGCSPRELGRPPECPTHGERVEIFFGLDDPDRIDFAAESFEHFSGLDLMVDPSASGVVIDLLVNGTRSPSQVSFVSPDTTPRFDRVSAPAMPCMLSVLVTP